MSLFAALRRDPKVIFRHFLDRYCRPSAATGEHVLWREAAEYPWESPAGVPNPSM